MAGMGHRLVSLWMEASGCGWFRSGKLEIRVGEPLCFALEDSETEITEKLRAEVAALLEGASKG